MSRSCPIPTPAERSYGDIRARIEAEMMRKVRAAVQDAADRARAEMAAAGLDMPPPSHGYFAATVHQTMYCILCGADPYTFAGGRPDTAIALIRNSQNIAKHHWGADIEPHPRP